jgi:hypothetical protein
MKHLIDLGSHKMDLSALMVSRLLVQANSGGGKSWAIRRLLEQAGRMVRFWVIDPEGEFFTLREMHDLVLVRAGGDVRPSIKTAASLSTALLEAGTSAVLDLSEFSPLERREYVKRFLGSLIAAPQRLWEPLLVVVDEAHHFAPEDGDSCALEAVNDLMTKGRKRAYCGILATQRLSKLAKDSAAEAKNQMIGGATLDVDQKRAADTLGWSREKARELRDLPTGHFYSFGPAFPFRGVELVQVGSVQTSHGREALRTAKLPTASKAIMRALPAIEALDTPDPNRIDDIDEAKRRIADLYRQLAAKGKKEQELGGFAPAEISKMVDAAVTRTRADARKAWLPIAKSMRQSCEQLEKQLNNSLMDAGSLRSQLSAIETLMNTNTISVKTEVVRFFEPKLVPRLAPRSPTANGSLDTLMTQPQRELLGAFGWFAHIGIEEPTREQLCFRLGWRPTSSHISNVLGSLRSAGLVDQLRLTPAGKAIATTDGPVDLAGYHAQLRRCLSQPQEVLFNHLLKIHPQEIGRDELCEAVGWSSTSSHISNILGGLRSAGIVKRGGTGLTPMVFPEGLS